jgi:hypothetical protein
VAWKGSFIEIEREAAMELLERENRGTATFYTPFDHDSTEVLSHPDQLETLLQERVLLRPIDDW